MGDPVAKMKGVSGVQGNKLAFGRILIVVDMIIKTNTDLLTLNQNTTGISPKKLTQWRNFPAKEGTCPRTVADYRKANIPYLEKFDNDG